MLKSFLTSWMKAIVFLVFVNKSTFFVEKYEILILMEICIHFHVFNSRELKKLSLILSCPAVTVRKPTRNIDRGGDYELGDVCRSHPRTC